MGYLSSGSRSPNLEEIGQALQHATGAGPIPSKRVPGLCGPNEVIQILLDPNHLAVGAVAYVLSQITKPFRKGLIDPHLEKAGSWLLEAAKEVPAFLTGITATSRLLAAERAAGNATSIGIEVDGHPRGASFLITEDDPGRLGAALLLLNEHGSTIRQLVADPPFRQRPITPESATSAAFVMDRADAAISIGLDEFNRLYLPLHVYFPSDRIPTVGWIPRTLRLYL